LDEKPALHAGDDDAAFVVADETRFRGRPIDVDVGGSDSSIRSVHARTR
jgi:hypothetical protein